MGTPSLVTYRAVLMDWTVITAQVVLHNTARNIYDNNTVYEACTVSRESVIRGKSSLLTKRRCSNAVCCQASYTTTVLARCHYEVESRHCSPRDFDAPCRQ